MQNRQTAGLIFRRLLPGAQVRRKRRMGRAQLLVPDGQFIDVDGEIPASVGDSVHDDPWKVYQRDSLCTTIVGVGRSIEYEHAVDPDLLVAPVASLDVQRVLVPVAVVSRVESYGLVDVLNEGNRMVCA